MVSTRAMTNLNTKDFNYLFFFNLVLVMIGSIFLTWNGATTGIIYSIMFLGMTSLLFLTFLFLKDDKTLKPIPEYIKIPIATETTLASFLYLIGMVTPFIVSFVLKPFTSFSITSFSIPLFSADSVLGGQTFATATIGESMAWKIFNIMFVAGNLETFVYNFGLPVIGILIGIMVLKLITNGKQMKLMSRKAFVLAIAFTFSTLLFVFSHVMNQSYGVEQFIVAGIFLLVVNISVYLGGVFLLFWAGYHQSNNLLYLIQVEGLTNVLNGFISWFGVIFIVYIGLITYYMINNWDKVKKDMRQYWNS